MITALAVAAVVAVVVDETAAVVLGIGAIALAGLAALVLSARRRARKVTDESSPGASDEKRALSEDPRIPIARARLQEVASQLDLNVPSTAEPAPEGPDFEPLISLIVPCFNDAEYVRDALESVRRQTYPHWECIVVDDASTDSSRELTRDFSERDSRFHLIGLDSNTGSGAARNRGIEASSGEYVAFLDADDMLLARSLEDRVSALELHQGDALVVGSFCAVRSESQDVTLDSLPDRRHATQPPFIDLVVAAGECPFTLNAPLVASDAVRSLGGFDESMTSGAVDWDLWYRMLRNGHVFVPSRTLGAIYRQKQGGITRTNKAAHTEASSRLIKAAYQPAGPALLTAPTAYPMPDPLGDYQARLVIAERAVRFASMALAEGDVGDMLKTLAVLERGTWPLLDRHLDWKATVGRGVARVVGLRPKHLPGLEDVLTPFIHTIKTAVAEVTA